MAIYVINGVLVDLAAGSDAIYEVNGVLTGFVGSSVATAVDAEDIASQVTISVPSLDGVRSIIADNLSSQSAISVPDLTIVVSSGTICWGHSTGVAEDNTKTFASNWTGTAAIQSSGDDENVALDSAEYEESETWEIGAGRVQLTIDKYGTGSGSPITKYKQGSSSANCEADSWHTYTVPFLCGGWIKIRIEAA